MSHGSLEAMAEHRGIIVPQDKTLAQYGLSRVEWLGMLCVQGWQCPICLKRTGVKWVTDHRHVPGWKNLPPEERSLYVRGILCSYCNHRRVHSQLTAREAARVSLYFDQAERRVRGGDPCAACHGTGSGGAEGELCVSCGGSGWIDDE